MSEWQPYEGEPAIAPQYEPTGPPAAPKPARVGWAWWPTLSAVASIVGVFGPWPDNLPRVEFGWVFVLLMIAPAVLWGVAAARQTLVLGISALVLAGLCWLGADSHNGWGLWLVTAGAVGVLVAGGVVGLRLGARDDLTFLEAQQAHLSRQIRSRRLR